MSLCWTLQGSMAKTGVMVLQRGLCFMQKCFCRQSACSSLFWPAPVGIIDVALLDAPGQRRHAGMDCRRKRRGVDVILQQQHLRMYSQKFSHAACHSGPMSADIAASQAAAVHLEVSGLHAFSYQAFTLRQMAYVCRLAARAAAAAAAEEDAAGCVQTSVSVSRSPMTPSVRT